MSRQSDLIAFVERCRSVVEDEIALLSRWEEDPGLGHGRVADCGLARRDIEDRRDEIAEVLDAVSDLSQEEVTASPGPARLEAASRAEQSFRARSGSNGAALSDADFNRALTTAKDNARAATSTAQEAVKDCT
jgi:hypothetical protein